MHIRLCYASSWKGEQRDLLEDLNHILSCSREFNSNNQINGVLYYADGSFFQCLEGEKLSVIYLFEKIKTDIRHSNIIDFGFDPIHQISFKKWSMKYVQKKTDIDLFFKAFGYGSFSPQALDKTTLPLFIEKLIKTDQTKIRKRIGLNNRGINPFL